jgi:hypothetical protein
MQENQRGAKNTPIQDLPYTLRFGCDAPSRDSLARVNSLTSIGHYAEGLGNLRVNGPAE